MEKSFENKRKPLQYIYIYIIKLLLLVVGAVLAGTLLMIFLYSIPTERTVRYAEASAELYDEGLIENWSDGAAHSILSNSTDALMIMHAIYRPYESAVDNAMLNPHPEYEDSDGAVQSLSRCLAGEEEDSQGQYARYWHGYLIYIIPALQILTVGELKVVMMYVQFLLAALVMYELGKRNKVYMLMYAVAALFLNPVTTVLTFQNADIYCIMMISMILVLKYNDWFREKSRYLYFFALNGIAVAFMDYLTYPLVAYGIPLITVLLINEYKFKESIKQMFLNSIAWGWGYAGMWAGKWVMADLLTESNTVKNALGTAAYRMTGETQSITDMEGTFAFAVSHIFDESMDRPMWILGILAILMLFICVYRKKARYHSLRNYAMASSAIALVGLVPFVWYFVVRNHTIIHPHLAYRQLAVSVWAALVMMAMPFVSADQQTET